ncbi:hypothetical protein GCM10010191_02370 [Actinomadura vinacea]|uniref:DUF4383 domain-containing protein n=1 Tax=Actinomadura vinacea TaxID=115336 RepID=A0ABN3IBA3_9ACTN
MIRLGLKSLNAIAIAVLFSGVVGALIHRYGNDSGLHVWAADSDLAVYGAFIAAVSALVFGCIFAVCAVKGVDFGAIVAVGAISWFGVVNGAAFRGEGLHGLVIGVAVFITALIVGFFLTNEDDNTAVSATSGAVGNTAVSTVSDDADSTVGGAPGAAGDTASSFVKKVDG